MATSEPVYWDCYYQRPQVSAVLPRVVRSSANEKERGRVQTVNTAFTHLRTLIPTDPKDRKLSKVETLRLAASYISHLSSVLIVGSSDNQPCTIHRNPRQARNVCTFCISGCKNRSSTRRTSAAAAMMDNTPRSVTDAAAAVVVNSNGGEKACNYAGEQQRSTLPSNTANNNNCYFHQSDDRNNLLYHGGGDGAGQEANDDWLVYSSNQAVAQWLAVQDSMVGEDGIISP